MLKKANRLAKDKDIATAFAKGRTFFNHFFTVKYVPLPGLARFTVVVSTKVSKNATRRNRLKRIIREVLRKRLSEFKSGDHLIVLKPKAEKLKDLELISNFLNLFGKK